MSLNSTFNTRGIKSRIQTVEVSYTDFADGGEPVKAVFK